jgi:thioredoxin reductase (NADPH)
MTQPAIPETELVIVGAGPVGLYAAYYAGFRALRCLVLESLPFVGGQIATFYPESLLYDVPGFPEIRGAELVERLAAQARGVGADIRLGVRVTGLERAHDRIRIRWRRENDADAVGPIAAAPTIIAAEGIETRAVLLTTGIGPFAPQAIPDPTIDAWRGKGLEYHVGDPGRFAGRRVLVAGGTQRGVELATSLAAARAQATLIHRRDRLAVPADLRARFDASEAVFLPFRELVGLEGGATVERAVVADRRDGTTEALAVDAVVPCFGWAAHDDATSAFPVPREDGAVPVDSTMAAAEGIWAAGDGATYPGKVRVLAADFGEACTAVNSVAASIVPGASVFPGYSSHRRGAPRRPA